MRHLTTIVAILLVSSSAAVAQAQEQKRPDPEVVQDKTPKPAYSGATVNIIRNLKRQEYRVDREVPHIDWPLTPIPHRRLPSKVQFPEKIRPDPEVIEDKTPAAPMPVYSGATINIIRQEQLAPLPLPRFPCVDWPGGCKPPDLKSVR
jgi:hypothetical protein